MQPASVARRERLPAHPSSVGTARGVLRGAATGRLPSDVVDTAELLVSELVTNAVVHAGTPVDLEVAVVDHDTVVVQVTDGSVHAPAARPFDQTAGTGRGLLLIEELADHWGVTEMPDGKTVWFCLAVEPSGSTALPGLPTGTRPPVGADAGTVEVRLEHVPLVLHAEWQRHASGLLREFLLVSLDGEDASAQVAAHAACSDAVALLSSSVPRPGPEDEQAVACDGEVWRDRITLHVPADTVGHFAVLDDTMDRAVDLAETDVMLTPSTSPAMRSFRRWVCRQVLDQAAGRSATPWPGV